MYLFMHQMSFLYDISYDLKKKIVMVVRQREYVILGSSFNFGRMSTQM